MVRDRVRDKARDRVNVRIILPSCLLRPCLQLP